MNWIFDRVVEIEKDVSDYIRYKILLRRDDNSEQECAFLKFKITPSSEELDSAIARLLNGKNVVEEKVAEEIAEKNITEERIFDIIIWNISK